MFSFHFWLKVGKNQNNYLEKKWGGEGGMGVDDNNTEEKSKPEVMREEKEGVVMIIQEWPEHQKAVKKPKVLQEWIFCYVSKTKPNKTLQMPLIFYGI